MNTKKLFLIFSTFFALIQFALPDEYKVPKYAYDLDVCDIDNDGDIDIVVGSNNQGSDTISILFNDGYGNFSLSFLAKSNYSNIKCSCIDEDDNPDIAALSRPDSGWVFYPNVGNGNFGNSELIYRTTEQKIELYYINEDTSPDFVSYDQGIGGGFGILYNNGTGVFSHYDIYSAAQSISEPAVGELNGDSLNDILLSDYDGGAFVFYNQGMGLFNQQSIDINPATDTYIFDVNNDGYNDLGIYYHVFFPNGICRLKVYENQSYNFILQDEILFPTGTKFRAFSDFNNDGFFDIVYMQSTWDEIIDSLFVVFNNQDFTFSSPDRYFVSNPLNLKVAASDFDGNGYNDIAYTFYGGQNRISILFNDGTGIFQENPLTFIENPEYLPIFIEVYPNPFSSITQIRIGKALENINNLYISIHDIKGQLVRELQSQDYSNEGDHFIYKWDGKNNKANPCPSGIYILRCRYGNTTSCRKLILINN